ncbi:MAG: flagellar biosynthesis protein, partial [Lachnospiraceae bacterium]|nr:flagellar biosynthesis protein [Lachnospiraceae bacterium]
SESATNEENFDYLPNETITTTKGEIGAVDYANSSLSLIAKNIIVYNEDVLRASGALDEMTFAEYQEANGDL